LPSLRELTALRVGELVFFGQREGTPLAEITVRTLLWRFAPDASLHGMRSCFSDWCADTGKPGDLAEAALAHVSGSQVQRAYQRSDLLAARRGLMVAWADYLTKPAEVVRLAAPGRPIVENPSPLPASANPSSAAPSAHRASASRCGIPARPLRRMRWLRGGYWAKAVRQVSTDSGTFPGKPAAYTISTAW
jgi:hypothetical protein